MVEAEEVVLLVAGSEGAFQSVYLADLSLCSILDFSERQRCRSTTRQNTEDGCNQLHVHAQRFRNTGESSLGVEPVMQETTPRKPLAPNVALSYEL